MDSLVVMLSAAGGLSIAALLMAFFHPRLARILAVLSLLALTSFWLLALRPGGLNNLGFLAIVLIEPPLLSSVVYGSMTLSLTALFAPLRQPTAMGGTRPRWVLLAGACGVTLMFGGRFASSIDEISGERKTMAMLTGSDSVEFEEFVIEHGQIRILCTDPEVLRNLETRCRRNIRTHQNETGLAHLLTLRFRGGGRQSFPAFWNREDVALYPEGGDGRTPYLVSLAEPLPKAMKQMIDLLLSDTEKSAGTVLRIDPGAVRIEKDPTLVAR